MHTDYLKKLRCCLEATKAYDAEGNAYKDYEELMEKLFVLFTEKKEQKKKLFFIGNGGSAGIASHMTVDFMKNGGMRTCSLYDASVLTCMGNDYGYEYIFSKPLEYLGEEGDLLVAISSSGNSQNIVNAIHAAQKKKMRIVTFSGFERNNKIIGMGELNVHVPICHYGIVESIHNLILQQLVDTLLERAGGACD
ncbi:MAG: SIS domain-containing protein [Roseburia sp.]